MTLTADGFAKLLKILGDDAEKYENLRAKLCRFFVWRGCPETRADALADETLDRMANKLAEGVEIQNINAYATQIARFVRLEFFRKNKEEASGDDLPEQSFEPEFNDADAPDERIMCLRKCLAETIPDAGEQYLIIKYYEAGDGEMLKNRRKKLAEKLGTNLNNMKVKAYRLREKLERCINDCVGKSEK